MKTNLYLILVFTKSTDIHFRKLWLAPVTRDIDFEAEVKMTGSVRAKNRKRFTLYYFFENKVHFYFIILVNTKTSIPLRVGAYR